MTPLYRLLLLLRCGQFLRTLLWKRGLCELRRLPLLLRGPERSCRKCCRVAAAAGSWTLLAVAATPRVPSLRGGAPVPSRLWTFVLLLPSLIGCQLLPIRHAELPERGPWNPPGVLWGIVLPHTSSLRLLTLPIPVARAPHGCLFVVFSAPPAPPSVRFKRAPRCCSLPLGAPRESSCSISVQLACWSS